MLTQEQRQSLIKELNEKLEHLSEQLALNLDTLEEIEALESGDQNNILLAAANDNNLKTLKRALQKGADVNAKDEQGRTALILAAKNGNQETIKFLIGKKANLDIQDSLGFSALMHAVYNEHNKIVEILANQGANLNLKSKKNKTALNFADEKQFNTISDFLNQRNAIKTINIELAPSIVIAKEPKEAKAAVVETIIPVKRPLGRLLIQAASKNDLKQVEMLIQAGVDVNYKDEDGATALMHAAGNGHLNIVEYLTKEARAEATLQDNKGLTALMYAAAADKDNTKVLIALHMANKKVIEKEAPDGSTALLKAIQSETMDNLRFLVPQSQSNHHIEQAFNAGSTRQKKEIIALTSNQVLKEELKSELEGMLNSDLIQAAREGNLEKVNELIGQDADVNSKDEDGNTPLIAALTPYDKQYPLIKNKINTAQALLNKGANPNPKIDSESPSPLMIAAQFENDTRLMQLLIEKKADVNYQDKDGNTALMIAATALGKNEEVISKIELLVRNNAEINTQTNNGDTALMKAAKMAKNHKIVQLLLNRGANAYLKNNQGETALDIAQKARIEKNVTVLINHLPFYQRWYYKTKNFVLSRWGALTGATAAGAAGLYWWQKYKQSK